MLTKLRATVGKYDPHTRSVLIIASTTNPVDSVDAEGKPVKEALLSWDFSRFQDHPVVLWSHDNMCLAVGKAADIEFEPGVGLKMRVFFASAQANPLAEQLAHCVQEEIVRAVSVGFEPGAGTPRTGAGGETIIDRTNNLLLEVSFVNIGADPDAGTAALNPEAAETDEEKQRKRVSSAARELAMHRARKKLQKATVRTDAADDEQRYDTGGLLHKAKRTSIGGAYINARLSRTGVLAYRLPSGKIRRELRHPDEVFNADSLASLDSVPVIDIKDHTALVTPEDYRRATVGHVKSFRADGRFIASELVVQDGATLDAIDAGERTEISCGYACKLDMTPGVFEGEPYDCVQKGIRYNHVALCPPNRGRAGPEVGLRLDNQSEARWGVTNINDEAVMKTIRLDGKDYEVGSDQHISKLEEMAARELTKVTLDATTKLEATTRDLADAKKKLDETQARLDQKDADLTKVTLDAKKSKEEADKEKAELAKGERARIRAAVRLLRSVRRFFGDDDDKEDEDDEEKMDAKLDELLSKPERELHLSVIEKTDPKFDATEKSDDYIRSRFDSIIESAKKSKKSDRSVGGVVRTIKRETSRLDAKTDDLDKAMEESRATRDKAAAGAAKK